MPARFLPTWSLSLGRAVIELNRPTHQGTAIVSACRTHDLAVSSQVLIQSGDALITPRPSLAVQERDVSTRSMAYLRHPNSQYRYAIPVRGIGAHYGFVFKCGSIAPGISNLKCL